MPHFRGSADVCAGAALVVDGEARLLGIFTDGDLRRLLDSGELERLGSPVADFMGADPKSIHPGALIEEAQRVMQDHHIDQLPVLDDDGHAVGLIDVQDLLDVRL